MIILDFSSLFFFSNASARTRKLMRTHRQRTLLVLLFGLVKLLAQLYVEGRGIEAGHVL
jgi:hypothetical protein